MKRIRLAGLALVSTAVGLVATASSALAVPTFLPGSGNLTIKSGEGELIAGSNSFKCQKDRGSGSISSGTLGTFKVTAEGCKSTGFVLATCTGLSDKVEGDSTTEGTFHVRYLKKTEPESIGILFLPQEVHLRCTSLGITLLALVRGTLVCPITPTNKTVKTTEHYAVRCEKPNLTKVFNESGTAEESVALEASFNGGEFERAEKITTEEIADSIESKIDA
jgi:hypothetical protein